MACGVGGFLACATGSTPPATVTTNPAVLSNVAVQRDGETTVVDLEGLQDPIFTAFLGQDPLRVVVDLASVQPDQTIESLAVYDGLVEEVTVAEFADASGSPSTRIEVTLASEAEYEVTPQADRLAIRVMPTAGLAELEGPIDPEPLSPESDALAEETAATEAAAAFASEPPATRLTRVAADAADEEGLVLRLSTDGYPAQLESFTLEDPPRLVIDLPGVRSEAPKNVMEFGTAHAARVRLGQHADKVRVVVDGGKASNPFDERQIVPLPDGLLVTLGSGPVVMAALDQSDAVPAAMAEVSGEEVADFGADTEELPAEDPSTLAAAEPEASEATSWLDDADAAEELSIASPEEPGIDLDAEFEGSLPVHAATMRVYGVQYDAQATRDRVAILTERPTEYQLLRPDSETLVVSIPGGTLDPEAAVRVAPDAGGPISLVSAFQQPDVATPEVRIVVKRAPGMLPTVTRHGTMLFLDFARAGAVAEIPPVIAETAGGFPAPGPGSETSLVPEGDLGPLAPAAEGGAADKAIASAAAALAPAAPDPAALDPEQAIEVLEEGGLLDGKEYVGRRISLDFKDVDIQDVLRLIADVSDLNLIAGDEVTGQITIRLVDVPWDQALDVILLTKGLGFVRVGNVLRIAPAEILKQEEEARLQERRAKERLEDLVVKLQPVNYADVTEVSNMVKRLLTARGSVDVDKRTNTVIIKDIASVIDESTALIKAIDTQTPQVLIEAKVVEANLDFSRELGSEWGVGSNPDEDESDFEIAGTEPITIQDTGFPYEQANNIVVKNPIASTATGILNLGAFILDDRFDVDVRIAAAETEGEGKVISSPRVVTLDNREAIIQQGVAIPFQTFENGDAQLEFIDAVLMLKVTPHITADRSIIMKIEVTRNAPDESVPTPTGSPAIAKNQAKTETLVKDGQTLVLGGIYTIDKTDSHSRVPFMYTIPVLGKLFQSADIRDIRKELLIFVTPRVVVGPELPS